MRVPPPDVTAPPVTFSPGWWLGFDIGGTRTKAGVVDEAGEVRQAQLLDTEHQPFATIWERLLTVIDAAVANESGALRGVGIAAPGVVEATFGVRNLPGKVPGIEGFPMRELLEDRLGVAVRCVNDGAAATLRGVAPRGGPWLRRRRGPDPGHWPGRWRHPGRPAPRLSAPGRGRLLRPCHHRGRRPHLPVRQHRLRRGDAGVGQRGRGPHPRLRGAQGALHDDGGLSSRTRADHLPHAHRRRQGRDRAAIEDRWPASAATWGPPS